MVIWGAIWGLILGSLWGSHDPYYFYKAVGIIAGAIAGYTLRWAVRSEIETHRARPVEKPFEERDSAPLQVVPVIRKTVSVEPLAELHPHPLSQLKSEPLPQVQPRPQQELQPQPQTKALSQLPSTNAATPVEPDLATRLFTYAKNWLFGGNTIVRMGVLVLFVGLAFLAKYAADNALLPPELRLASIALVAVALFAGGMRLRSKNPGQLAYALTLQGAGVAVLYLTVFAAFRMYRFLPSEAAFVLLALICAFATVIALLQNAMVMAFIGFAGGFAAPILLSTGDGNHVGLFSYYLLLNIAIAAIAWVKAWRPLNLLGFFATFGVAGAWGVLKYQPGNFASSEPFLIAFFLIYVIASLLYATRHSLGAKRAVDATLVFGTPLVAFGLQAGMVRDMPYATAFSSLTLGAFYLALGSVMLKRNNAGRSGAPDVGRWLAECFAALGLGFVTLTIPLALDANWTSAVWAAEGAAVYWMGRRQDRWLARAAGLLLQVLAAMSYLHAMEGLPQSPLAFANPEFIGAVLLAGSALGIAWWSRSGQVAPTPTGPQQFTVFEAWLSPILFWTGFLWWQFGLGQEITRAPIAVDGNIEFLFGHAMQLHLRMLAWLGTAFVFHHLALPRRTNPWRITATPAWFVLPVMVLAAVYGMLQSAHVFRAWGWIAWPIALLLHARMLHALDTGAPAQWWPRVHAGTVWLLVLLVGNLLVFSVGIADMWQTAWATVILLVAGIVVLLLLSLRTWFDATSGARAHWPLDRFARAYLWSAAAPMAVAVAIGCLVVAMYSDGNARPLPYVPLLNPTDLSVGLGLAACALWLARIRGSNLAIPAWGHHARLQMGLMAIAFVAINTVWLRVAHQYADVPWNMQSLFDSFLVQAGYSILWTFLALGLMVVAHRRHSRATWTLGASLLGATVVKLFVIDLSNRGGSERIFVFIAVGMLMLVVGYFAPIPPAEPNQPGQLADDAADPQEVKT